MWIFWNEMVLQNALHSSSLDDEKAKEQQKRFLFNLTFGQKKKHKKCIFILFCFFFFGLCTRIFHMYSSGVVGHSELELDKKKRGGNDT